MDPNPTGICGPLAGGISGPLITGISGPLPTGIGGPLRPEYALRESLERTGFQSIKEFAPGESDDPQLAGLEVRHKEPNHATNDYETMVFQAVRP